MTKGIISEIRGFSTQDGPGIRTTIFMKSCPLRCKWCSSPETWTKNSQIYFFPLKCKQCGACAEVCMDNAITSGEGRIVRDKCTLCMRCTEVCPAKALKIVGEEITVDEAINKIKTDIPFFNRSRGGMTVSGGEPLAQFEFVRELMMKCQAEKIHTCLDTCAFGDIEDLKEIAKYTDLILISLKHMDSKKHIQLTGVSNEIILKNIKVLAQENQVRISLPIIPGANGDDRNIRETSEFVKSCDIKFIDIEPYHKLGQSKYEALGMTSPYDSFEELSEERLLEITNIIESYGLKTTRGRNIN